MSEVNEISEMWREHHEYLRKQRDKRRARGEAEIEDFTAGAPEYGNFGLKVAVRKLTTYHYRVAEVLDLYPTNSRYHNLKTGERGRYPWHGQPFKKFVAEQLSKATERGLL